MKFLRSQLKKRHLTVTLSLKIIAIQWMNANSYQNVACKRMVIIFSVCFVSLRLFVSFHYAEVLSTSSDRSLGSWGCGLGFSTGAGFGRLLGVTSSTFSFFTSNCIMQQIQSWVSTLYYIEKLYFNFYFFLLLFFSGTLKNDLH